MADPDRGLSDEELRRRCRRALAFFRESRLYRKSSLRYMELKHQEYWSGAKPDGLDVAGEACAIEEKRWRLARRLLELDLGERGGRAPAGRPESVQVLLDQIAEMVAMGGGYIHAGPDPMPGLEGEVVSLLESLGASSGGPGLEQESSLPAMLRGLATVIRLKNARQRHVPQLLDLLAEEGEVDFETIKHKVHGTVVEDETVAKNILKTRKAIVEAGLPIALVESDRRVGVRPIP
jgi:hypothetical protein